MAAQRLDDLAERLELRSPARVVELLGERLEGRAGRLRELARDALHKAEAGLECHAERLVPAPHRPPRAARHRHWSREAGARAPVRPAAGAHRGGAGRAGAQLESLSHRRVLERGYAIVRGRSDGHLVPSLAASGPSELEITFADGQLPVRRLGTRRGRSASGAATSSEPGPPAVTGIDRLLAVMARLRDPEGGCPWDVEQNFATIAPYTIEEAYEVADAIERERHGGARGASSATCCCRWSSTPGWPRRRGAFDFDRRGARRSPTR